MEAFRRAKEKPFSKKTDQAADKPYIQNAMKNPLDFQPIRAIFPLANRENSTIVHQKALQGIISEALFMPLFAKVLYQQAEPELGSKLRKPRDSNGGKRKKLNSPIFTP